MSPRDRLLRSDGQATSEYVGLLALVAVVLSVAGAAVAAPPLAAHVTAAMRHGICLVAGGVCTPREASRAGLSPCVVAVNSDGETLGGVVAVLRLRRGDTAVLERRSDGTAVVSFLDANAAGAETGVGLQVGAAGALGSATAAAGVTFNTGRSHEFATWAEAQRFLERYAGQETTAGEALDAARRLSPLHERRRLPAPQSTSFEAGGWADLDAELEVPLPRLGRRGGGGEAGVQAAELLGRRRQGARSTWYLRVENEIATQLGLVVAAVGGSSRGESVLELTTEAGRPVALTVATSAAVAGELSLYGHSGDLGALASKLGRAAAGAGGAGTGGLAMEASVSLDLTVAENRAALTGAMDVLRLRAAPPEWPSRLRALADRLDSSGALEVSVFRTTTQERDQSLELALGAKLGVERVTRRTTRELVSAWSGRGGPLREREDCAAAAA